MKDKTIMMPTTDDWYPNFPNDEVQVSKLNLCDGTFRVCVWGNDDMGMEIDLELEGECEYMFELVERQSTITKEWLKEQGFVTA